MWKNDQMNDAIAAVGGVFAGIPIKIRRTLYAVFGLIVIIESIWDIIPEPADSKVLATWGVFNSIMALGNTVAKPAEPPAPNGGVEPQFPDEFA